MGECSSLPPVGLRSSRAGTALGRQPPDRHVPEKLWGSPRRLGVRRRTRAGADSPDRQHRRDRRPGGRRPGTRFLPICELPVLQPRTTGRQASGQNTRRGPSTGGRLRAPARLRPQPRRSGSHGRLREPCRRASFPARRPAPAPPPALANLSPGALPRYQPVAPVADRLETCSFKRSDLRALRRRSALDPAERYPRPAGRRVARSAARGRVGILDRGRGPGFRAGPLRPGVRHGQARRPVPSTRAMRFGRSRRSPTARGTADLTGPSRAAGAHTARSRGHRLRQQDSLARSSARGPLDFGGLGRADRLGGPLRPRISGT